MYPELVSEFYAHMQFIKDTCGNLKCLATYVQGKKIVIDQTVLLDALKLDPNMLRLPKINHYVTSVADTVINFLNL